jgi:tRNA threonylcarbamoyladenosine biosynthesis protein TsaB
VNPLVLAIDTTRERGSLALARGDETIEEVPLEAPGGFAHVIYGHMASLLERHSVRLCDIECFAAAAGPGSFTGVRVGLACIKGLAEACGRPAAGISNLQALSTFGSAALRAVVLDARRGEVYAAVYDPDGGIVAPEIVMPLHSWLDTLPAGDLEFVVSVDAPVRLDGTRFDGARVTVAPSALAAAIARIACQRLARGEALDPAALDANYVRRSDAELFWKE